LSSECLLSVAAVWSTAAGCTRVACRLTAILGQATNTIIVARARWVEVAQAFDVAVAALPGCAVGLDAFAAAVERQGIAAEALARNAVDLYLAWASALHDSRAIAVLERDYFPVVRRALRRLTADIDEIAEWLQVGRERLLTGTTPRIGGYNGNIPLREWLKIVVAHLAIDSLRARASKERLEHGWMLAVATPEVDPFHDMVVHHHRSDVEKLLKDSLAGLEARERTVIKLHYWGGISAEKIAAAYGVHRVTVARWLWRALDRLLGAVHEKFHKERAGSASECESLLRVLRQCVEISMSEPSHAVT
jgi:RNA polymerase sigma-70 factor, ECF subfamily